ncbi:50S ribosomal protein HLP, mitochondrial [Glycine max]|nr:50S ribosomal protein HLP, mitochondrial [Glycine max]
MTWFCIVPVLFFTAPRFPFLLLPLCFFAFIIPFPWLNNRCFVRWVQEKRSKFQPWLQPLLQDVLFQHHVHTDEDGSEGGGCDGSEVKFDDKQGQPIGTRVFGPVPHELRQNNHVKILTLAGHIA